ncbi:hypothetical protein BT93_I0884 [Corymbia citriodora subsp. variegata]|nr:hypothetical protein BT93_I0884 [Corymbia citriodora subsp. variegata]
MQLHLSKALFLSYLLTVTLSCEAAPGELNATATPLPCDSAGSTTECLIAYQQPQLEAMVDPPSIKFTTANQQNPAGCGRPVEKNNLYCTPPENGAPRCGQFYRVPC